MEKHITRILILTSFAMIAFAANSVFNRIALVETQIDPLSFTTIRIAAGAIMLWLIFSLKSRDGFRLPKISNFGGALSLYAYAVFFSFAYVSLGAGLGALILFASVQLTMIIWALVKGERPGPIKLMGMLIAFFAFIYLVLPDLQAPNPQGTIMMIIAGVSWGVYSLIGRNSVDPVADTAANFIAALPIALIALLVFFFFQAGAAIDIKGAFYAVLSGTLASGVGYAIWYAALPTLSRTTASVVQLTVPAIAAIGGILFLNEALSLHFIIASGLIFFGVGLATLAKN